MTENALSVQLSTQMPSESILRTQVPIMLCADDEQRAFFLTFCHAQIPHNLVLCNSNLDAKTDCGIVARLCQEVTGSANHCCLSQDIYTA